MALPPVPEAGDEGIEVNFRITVLHISRVDTQTDCTFGWALCSTGLTSHGGLDLSNLAADDMGPRSG